MSMQKNYGMCQYECNINSNKQEENSKKKRGKKH